MGGWLLGSLRAKGPFPILILHGEQGSGKSYHTRLLRALLDPSLAPIRTAPASERDLMITAQHSWVLALDNLSGVSPKLADALCRLATGGGLSLRRLYTDGDETIFDAMRPAILNGIDDLGNRQDLADRAIILHLPAIADSARRTEASLWQGFHQAAPGIIGALCTAASAAFRQASTDDLCDKPRMADFAQWIVAAEDSLGWPSGSFMKAYQDNRQETVEIALEYDLVATALRGLLARQADWTGTATQLLATLEPFVAERSRSSSVWPRTPRSLSVCLRRIVTSLRKAEIHLTFRRESAGRRLIFLERSAESNPIEAETRRAERL